MNSMEERGLVEEARGPLHSVRVLDLSRNLAGAVCTMLLCDQGAEVIRLDDPDVGDVAGELEDAYPDGGGPAVWHRGKMRGVALPGLPQAVASVCDVVVATPDTEGAPEFDCERARLDDPELIVCEIVANRHDSGWPSADVVVRAKSGLMYQYRGNRSGPIFHEFPLPSYQASFLALLGVTGGLLSRARGGQGDRIRVSLYDGVLTCMSMYWTMAEHPPPMMAVELTPERMPHWLFEARDGEFLNVHPAASGAFEAIQRVLGLETADGETFYSYLANPRLYYEKWERRFKTRPRAEWLDQLWDAGVPALPVLAPGQAWGDSQVLANDLVIEVEHAELGPIRQVGRAQKFARSTGSNPRGVSRPGGDHQRILEFLNTQSGRHGN